MVVVVVGGTVLDVLEVLLEVEVEVLVVSCLLLLRFPPLAPAAIAKQITRIVHTNSLFMVNISVINNSNNIDADAQPN